MIKTDSFFTKVGINICCIKRLFVTLHSLKADINLTIVRLYKVLVRASHPYKLELI